MIQSVKRTMLISAFVVVITIASQLLLVSKANAHIVSNGDCVRQAIAQPAPPDDYSQYKICKKWKVKHNLAHICAGVIQPKPTTVKFVRASGAQRRNIARTIKVGYDMEMTVNEIISSVMAITVETRARNLSYGHSSSVGILQLLNIHGSYQWRMVIENSVGWYFRGAQKLNTTFMTPGQIADRIQRPAKRGVYDKYRAESTRTVKSYLGPMIVCLKIR